jgi:MFS family permease
MAERPSARSPTTPSYMQRWRHLSRPARLYLLHAALLTSSLAIIGLFFNLAILALGYPISFLGLLNTVAIAVAALLSLPLWWLATRIGLRWALLASGLLQAVGALLFALWPTPVPLFGAVALTGAAAVLFQVSAPPFMMRYSDPAARDHLFSANAAINLGFAGIGSLVAGGLPALFGRLLGVGASTGVVYRATFAIATAGLLLSLVPLLLIVEPPRDERTPATTDHQGEPGADAGDRDPSASMPPPASRRLPRVIAIVLARLPAPWRALLHRPWPLLMLLIPPFLISWGAALLIPYLNLFFKQRFAVADATLGLIFAGLNVATGVAALIGPLLSIRIGKIRTVALTQALSIPFLLTLGFAPLLGVVVGAALARQALFNMGAPLYDAFAMERTAEDLRPTVIGLINGAYSIGYLAAPTISTFVQERYGFGPLFVATTVCYGLAVLANYWFFVRKEPLHLLVAPQIPDP